MLEISKNIIVFTYVSVCVLCMDMMSMCVCVCACATPCILFRTTNADTYILMRGEKGFQIFGVLARSPKECK